MTQFAGSFIAMLAETRGRDPLVLWRAIALANAQDDEEDNDDQL
jgi:hypothetical protein